MLFDIFVTAIVLITYGILIFNLHQLLVRVENLETLVRQLLKDK